MEWYLTSSWTPEESSSSAQKEDDPTRDGPAVEEEEEVMGGVAKITSIQKILAASISSLYVVFSEKCDIDIMVKSLQ